MSSIKFKLDKKGVKELLKSQEMENIIEKAAEEKARQADAMGGVTGYEAATHKGKNRVYANVFPNSKDAFFDNLENNTLEKVIRNK